jgi:hypothetical protein
LPALHSFFARLVGRVILSHLGADQLRTPQLSYGLAAHHKSGIERGPLPIVVAHHVQPPIAQANGASATNATMEDVIQIRRQRRASRGSRSR